MKTKTRMNQTSGSRWQKGFSMIEIMIVTVVMLTLGSLSIPAFSGMVRAGKVSQGLSLVAGHIEMARLKAGAASRPVEIRFYQAAGSTDSTSGGSYTAFQLFILKDAEMKALTPVISLPEGVVIAADKRSSLLEDPDLGTGSGSGVAEGLTYRSFEISPNGETTLPLGGDPLCLALGEKRVVESSTEAAPGLAAVFVDALTGKARVVR